LGYKEKRSDKMKTVISVDNKTWIVKEPVMASIFTDIFTLAVMGAGFFVFDFFLEQAIVAQIFWGIFSLIGFFAWCLNRKKPSGTIDEIIEELQKLKTAKSEKKES